MYASSLMELLEAARIKWHSVFPDDDPIVELTRKGRYDGVVKFETLDGNKWVLAEFVDGVPMTGHGVRIPGESLD